MKLDTFVFHSILRMSQEIVLMRPKHLKLFTRWRLVKIQHKLETKKESEEKLQIKMAELEPRILMKEKEMEKEMLGLADTIKEHREEIAKLKVQIDQLENQNQKSCSIGVRCDQSRIRKQQNWSTVF